MGRKQASIPTKEDPTIRRSHLSPDKLLTSPEPGKVEVVADLIEFCAERYKTKTAALTRDIINIVEEKKEVPKKDGDGTETKTWKYFTLSEPKKITYAELATEVTHVSSGLRALGLGKPTDGTSEPPRDEDGRDRAGIYADTSLNWQIVAQSFARMGHPITTAYTTLGPEGLQHSLVEPSVKLLFTNSGLLSTLAEVIEEANSVKWVVYDKEKDADKSVVDKINAVLEQRGGKVVTLEQVKELGKASPLAYADFGAKPTRDDLFCIMYTSGSTGAPKGVLLTNNNIVSSLAGTKKLLQPLFEDNDMFLAFLPLAHILEMLVEFTFYLTGVPVAYGTVKTLTNDSVRNCEGDFVAYKPSIIVGVPAIWELIRKGMVKKIHDAPFIAQRVFGLAGFMKRNMPWPFGSIADVVFSKVKAATGGRLRLAMNGGAALSKETQEFLTDVLVMVLQGYGMTETCGMAAILVPEFFQTGSVGVIVPSIEIKLQDYPDAGYLATGKPPRGEVLLRGGSVTRGYYKRDDVNKESFTEDGWLKTGDIGQWNPDGTLSLIDRIKNLIKLRSGEYLALEKAESVYKSANIVGTMCVYATEDADKPIAIIFPNEGHLRAQCKQAGIECEGSLEKLCDDPKVQKLALKQLLETGKKGGLKGAEMIQGVVLSAEEWTAENGMLTAAQKLQRPKITKHYEKEIKAAYHNK